MAGETRNVFVSHVHEDDDGLARLKELLASKGCSIRDASITSETPNKAKDDAYIKSGILAPGINWAGTLIVYVSPATKASNWVDWEIEYAARQGKRIVGVWAQGASECDIPEALDKYADAVVGWNGDRIVDAIDGKVRDWTTSLGNARAERAISRHCA